MRYQFIVVRRFAGAASAKILNKHEARPKNYLNAYGISSEVCCRLATSDFRQQSVSRLEPTSVDPLWCLKQPQTNLWTLTDVTSCDGIPIDGL